MSLCLVSPAPTILFFSLILSKISLIKSTRAKNEQFSLPAGGLAGTQVPFIHACLHKTYCKWTSVRTQLYISAVRRNTRLYLCPHWVGRPHASSVCSSSSCTRSRQVFVVVLYGPPGAASCSTSKSVR